MKVLSAAVGALCLSLVAAGAQAAVLFAFQETGSGVVGALSGSLDLTGATQGLSGNNGAAAIHPNIGYIAVAGSIDSYEISGLTAFGPGGFAFGSGAGDAFGVAEVLGAGFVLVPAGYTSGTALNSTLTFAGETFATLGVTSGTYEYSLPNDTITLRFDPAVIPLPATLPLLLGALGLGLAALRRRG